MALAPEKTPYRFTVEEYLAFERAACDRHEYLDGEIYAMAGESPNHGRLCINLSTSLNLALRGTGCEVFGSNLKVHCAAPGYRAGTRRDLFAYPDVVVVCGAMQFHDVHQDVLVNPTLLIEVLSPSTETFDRGEKLQRYRHALPMLQDYVLVAQDVPLLDRYHRDAPDRWVWTTVHGLDAVFTVETLTWTVPLVDVYDRVVFPGPEDTP